MMRMWAIVLKSLAYMWLSVQVVYMQFVIILNILDSYREDTPPPDFNVRYILWMVILATPGVVMLIAAERLKRRHTREREQTSKESGLELKKTELSTSKWHKPLFVAIIAATLAVIGSAVLISNPILVNKLGDFLDNRNPDSGPTLPELDYNQSRNDDFPRSEEDLHVSPEFLESSKKPDESVNAILGEIHK